MNKIGNFFVAGLHCNYSQGDISDSLALLTILLWSELQLEV